MKINKLIAAFLTVVTLSTLIIGCNDDTRGGDDTSTATTTDNVSKMDNNIEVMNFDEKLALKKPKEPISKEPFILFLGNSFVYENNMPAMFEELSKSGGINADVSDLSEGGYHLSFFADPNREPGAKAIDCLEQYDWDYVIMQEQSRLPTEKESFKEEMLPAVKKLDEMIKAANAQAVMLMTWAYKNGDNLTEFDIDKITTREEMQTELADSYIEAAKSIDSLLSPAGVAFIKSAKANPDIELWDEADDMHPTIAGTYLASCVLYATLYNQSPVALSFVPEGLTGEQALKLQIVAKDVVL